MSRFAVRVVILCLLAALPWLAGCDTVESVHPLSSPRAAVKDERLAGMWALTSGTERAYLYVQYGAENQGSLLYLGKDEETGVDGQGYRFFVTRTAQRNYLNLSAPFTPTAGRSDEPHPGTYQFASYLYAWPGRLVIMMANSDPFEKAVRAGKLKGKIEVTKSVVNGKPAKSTDVLLMDSSQHILSFIEAAKEEDLFGVPGIPLVFRKIGPP